MNTSFDVNALKQYIRSLEDNNDVLSRERKATVKDNEFGKVLVRSVSARKDSQDTL